MDAISVGADSGIDVKNEVRPPANTIENGTNEQCVERISPSVARRTIINRASSHLLTSDRNISSSFVGRYSTELPSRQKSMRLYTVSGRISSRQIKQLDDPRETLLSSISLQEAMENRPPLKLDMCGPSPTTYSPCNKPLYETNAPAFTFGTRRIQKSREKLLVDTQNPYTIKTNLDPHWPSPFHYQHRSTIGSRRMFNKIDNSNDKITSALRRRIIIQKSKEAPEGTPIIDYADLASLYCKPRAPCHIIGKRLPNQYGIPQQRQRSVPAPNTYSLQNSIHVTKPTKPSYTMCVYRGNVRHELGPFGTF